MTQSSSQSTLLFPGSWSENKPDKWDLRFLRMAKEVSTWSKDPSTQVGSVMVDMRNRVLGLGYNGLPRGIEDTAERLNDKETKYALTVHAEVNCLLNSQKPDGGYSKLYCTEVPCCECAKLIAQTNVDYVVAFDPRPEFYERWKKSFDLTKLIFQEAGIEWLTVPRSQIV